MVCQSSAVRRSYKDMEPWVHPAPCPISLLLWGGQRCPQECIVGDHAPQRAVPRPVLLLPGARSSPSPSARPFLASGHGCSSRVGRPGLLRASEDRNGCRGWPVRNSRMWAPWRSLPGEAQPRPQPCHLLPTSPACSQLRQRGVPDQLEVLSAWVQQMECRRTGWAPLTLSRDWGGCVCVHPDVHTGLQPLGHSSH